jgi:AcrR family transcriptional regulator
MPSPAPHPQSSKQPSGRRTRSASPARTGKKTQRARIPQQERGQRRVDAILDAAAQILVEEGSGGVTMHRVARRSGTTTGSMYHFFPDREALLRALLERHVAEIRDLLVRIEREAAPGWAASTTEEAVDGFLVPVLDYLDHRPALPAISRFAHSAGWARERDEKLDELLVGIGRALVRSRSPGAGEQETTARAVALIGIVEGIMGAVERAGTQVRRDVSNVALRRELRRALIGYLDSSPATGR